MKTNSFVIGLLLSCLLLLSACANAPRSSESASTELGCPRVTACRLPPSQPTNNGELLLNPEEAEEAWAACAAQVDMILDCQLKAEKAKNERNHP
ncbi:Rz1-like lysis system protein LysC [Pseudomonas helleri]|uniref:Rz1-like lysis system protein LysC n=1 Tax=Pseudomonas helleri TaxID=1608996 RepID=UPI002B208D00|nr:Rz1-like lysis system protein LysC [Pseudomonas helleri]